MQKKKGVLLVNLGSPQAPTYRAVYHYLTEFLLDPRVIDIPRWKRELLVRGLIIPLRIRSTTHAYQSIWSGKEAPLVATTLEVGKLLQEKCPDIQVEIAMRYQKPSMAEVLSRMQGIEDLTILPLFPQYASATVGSIFEEVAKILASWEIVPTLHFISHFYSAPGFIELLANRAESFPIERYDKILFSYHGLPERHLRKASLNCLQEKCCEKNSCCYRAQCLKTSEGVAGRLGLPSEKWLTTFQSRLGKEPWISPYTQETIRRLAKEGHKKILVFSPSFVADCLETTVEIGIDLKNEFISLGGEELDLVPSLNTGHDWIDFLESQIN